MKRLLIISILLLPATGIKAGFNPFKPYKPLSEIDWSYNWSLGHDSTSIAYKPDSFTERMLMPIGLLSTSILYNDNYLDKRIVKLGSISSPALQSANIIQYSPAAIMLALKSVGVESRSDWSRMITANMASIALMTGITNFTKYTVKRERPDGRAQNSYPSGHTATAFMCATMLHKEYGETLSPWIGATGYGIAATTGIFRVVSNRHWCSDVMCGAAIGIFSTEAAYELTDIVFGEHGLNKYMTVPSMTDFPKWRFGLYSDYSIGSVVFTQSGFGNPDAKPACSIGIDATWMPWYIGPVIRTGLTQMKWTGTNDIFLPDQGSVADVFTAGAGLEMCLPLLRRLSLNGQAIAGYSPETHSYSFMDTSYKPLKWDIPAGMHCYANIGMEVRTTAFSSVSVYGGLDYYDKVWRSLSVGAHFNYTF